MRQLFLVRDASKSDLGLSRKQLNRGLPNSCRIAYFRELFLRSNIVHGMRDICFETLFLVFFLHKI